VSAVLEARGRTTRSSIVDRRRQHPWRTAVERGPLLPLALAIAVAVVAALLVYPAKTVGFDEARAGLKSGEMVNLNAVRHVEQLDPVLRAIVPDPRERAFIAAEVFRQLPGGGAKRAVENVGALAVLRVNAKAVATRADLPALAARASADTSKATIGLFTPDEFQALKPSLVVREDGSFSRAFALHLLLLVLAFAGMHVGLHATGKSGDRWILPIAVVLTGIGFAMLVSLRDPLRDQMLFTRFAQGTLFGGLAMVLCAIPQYERTVLRRLAFVPLLAALGLSVALVFLGRGPTGSDARVNLFGTQPMELVRLLLVLFLAGYFSSRWALLRELDEPPLGDAWYLQILKLPRLHHVLPVAIGVAASVLLFFVQRDLGPALLLVGLFLSFYAITRRDVGLVVAGLTALLGAFAFSSAIGFPRTVSLRTAMWLDPWDNGLAHGDQIAQGFWAFASGGFTGTGLGLGAPSMVPAAHTDLIIAAIGEELGFVGVLACLGLLALLVVRGFRIARRAPEAYTMYLALGLTLGFALQTLLITGGVAGLMPLSGVVTPFLSFGRSAQVVHFATLGILWSLAASGAALPVEMQGSPRIALAGRRSVVAPPRPVTALSRAFDRPRGVLLAVLGVFAAAVVLKLAWVQIAGADATFARGSLALQADGESRYQYNPRLRLVAESIPRGKVFDRNGVLLASSRWKDITDRRDDYKKYGVDIDQACLATDDRHYPFGGVTFHVLGDLVSRRNWGAGNTAYVERSQEAFLSGYDDHPQVVAIPDPKTGKPQRMVRRDMTPLVALWRDRHRPWHPKLKAMLKRDRDLTLTLDIRLQQRAAALLHQELASAHLERGAVVVMDPDSGELLACASEPSPAGPIRGDTRFAAPSAPPPGANVVASVGPTPPPPDPAASPLMDRARFGLYPPGSTFKLVTAAAALSQDRGLANARYNCRPLPGGRSGTVIAGRLVRDDEGHTAHGTIGMEDAMIVSCNAYFAQLGQAVGWPALREMGRRFGIAMGDATDEAGQRAHAIESAYGQAEVVATPLTMVRVAAAMAAGGRITAPHIVLKPRPVLAESTSVASGVAGTIAHMMRGVVERGTAYRLAGVTPAIAGKTGTAQVANGQPHAWFVGYAPYGGGGTTAHGRRIAFGVLIENGGYGAMHAANVAARIVAEARRLGII
jgi:cell division protein FtsW (lipid II flippase)/cell division protein FtsI/penicillin-binding protein 2